MVPRLLFLSFGLGFCLSLATGTACAQSASAPPVPLEDQNETMRDTLKRMQIKREEDEHKKLLGRGTQIKDNITALSKEASGARLPLTSEKKLKDIEKSARQIRSETGGGEDQPLETPPDTLEKALKQLLEASERLNEHLAKTSRRVVSITVVEDATEIIQLVKLLRSYLN